MLVLSETNNKVIKITNKSLHAIQREVQCLTYGKLYIEK